MGIAQRKTKGINEILNILTDLKTKIRHRYKANVSLNVINGWC